MTINYSTGSLIHVLANITLTVKLSNITRSITLSIGLLNYHMISEPITWFLSNGFFNYHMISNLLHDFYQMVSSTITWSRTYHMISKPIIWSLSLSHDF